MFQSGGRSPRFSPMRRRAPFPLFPFVEPRFLGEELGLSNDDHPHADVRNGEAFLNLVYSAVTRSPGWSRTVFVINYDEWSGFFDHVPPTVAPIPPADNLAGNADGLRGFRTPCLVISPFAQREHVAHLELDHTSILRMIEWRWGLAPLTERDASANNLAEALNFAAPDLAATQFEVPGGSFGPLCPAGGPLADEEWLPLLNMAKVFGWPV
jgi:phospholipase C